MQQIARLRSHPQDSAEVSERGSVETPQLSLLTILQNLCDKLAIPMNPEKSVHCGIILSFFLSFFDPTGGSARAQERGTEEEKLRQEIVELNRRLRGSSAGRAAGRPLREAAEARKKAMVELMRTAPSEALSLALSAPERQALTAQDPSLDALLETQGRWSGDIETYVFDDFEGKTARTVNFLVSPSVRLEVHAAGRPLPGECGWTAEFEGIALDGVAAGFALKLERAVGAGDCTNMGEQRSLSVAIGFANRPASMSVAEVEEMMHSANTPSMGHFLRLFTRDQAWLTGKVVTVQLDRQYTCEEYGAMTEAVFRALSDTEDLTRYRRFVLFADLPGNCPWAGLGSVNCRRQTSLGNHWASISWIRVAPITSNYAWASVLRVVIHELGHNFGFHHSNARKFAGAPLGGSEQKGESIEYGDPFTVMGGALAPYTARQLLHAGWIAESQVLSAEGEGNFSIEAVSAPNTGPKALRVRRFPGVDEWLWVEYHRPEGPYYARWPTTAPQGALIYVEDTHNRDLSPTEGGKPNLLDMTPGSMRDDFRDAILANGREWLDVFSGTSIRVVDASDQLKVAVTRNRPCISVDAVRKTHGSGAETGEIRVTAPSSCRWEAVSSAHWLQLTGQTSGAGSAVIPYRVEQNVSGGVRRADIGVGMLTVAIEQSAGGVPFGNQRPEVTGLFPSSGSGTLLSLHIQARDGNGPSDIALVQMRLSDPDNGSACRVEYDSVRNEIRLEADDGRGWVTSRPGDNLTLENRNCRLRRAQWTAERENPAWLNLEFHFLSAFRGQKWISVRVADRNGAESEWRTMGRWIVPNQPQVRFLSPRTLSGPAARLKFTFDHALDGPPIQQAWFVIGAAPDWDGSCAFSYAAAPEHLAVHLGGEREWSPPAAMTEDAELSGPLCRLGRPQVRTDPAKGEFELEVTLGFPEEFRGDKRIWVKAVDQAGGELDWTEVGSIHVKGPNRAPAILGVRRLPGQARAGILEMHIEDPDGAIDVERVEIVINDRLEWRDACAIDATPADQFQWLWLSLRADRGEGSAGSWTAGAPATYSNSQCTLSVQRSTFRVFGTTAILRLDLELKPVMAGDQRIFVRVRDLSGATSPWMEADPWVVEPSRNNRAPGVVVSGTLPSRGHFLAVPVRVVDPDTARDVAAVELLLGSGPDDPAPCWMRYSRRLGRLELRSEDNTGWLQAAPGDLQLAHARCSVPADAVVLYESNIARVTLGAAFFEPFRGQKGVWARAIDAAGVESGWQRLGDFLVEPLSANERPVLDPLAPLTGASAVARLPIQARDPNGQSDLRILRFFLQSGLDPDRWCLVVHDRLSNLFLLGSDDSPVLQVFPNDGTRRENGRCRLLRTSTSSLSGGAFRAEVWVAFLQSMAGPVKIWEHTIDMSGSESDWHEAGVWNARLPNQPPMELKIDPAEGDGTGQEFELTVRDPDGVQDLRTVTLTVSADGSEVNSCRILAEVAGGWVALHGDHPFTGPSRWMSGIRDLQNGQCVVRSFQMQEEGDALKIRTSLQFLAGLGGSNRISLSAVDLSGASYVLRNIGRWTAPEPDPNRPPEPVRVERAPSGSTEVVSAVFSDPDGYGDLALLEVRIGDAAPVCAFRYDRRTHTFRISSDDGEAWGEPVWGQLYQPLGNSACSFIPWALQVSGSGTEMTIRLNVTFKQPMPADAGIWMAATDRAGNATGWVRK